MMFKVHCSLEEKVHATYMHACLKFVDKDSITNQTLRNRFGLDSKKNSVITYN
jgi:ATP-dependent DNA helicase RecG